MSLRSRAVQMPQSDGEYRQLADALKYRWSLHRRLDQTPPKGEWIHWLLLAGRGAGKTRTGAETVRWWVETGQSRLCHFVAATAADIRDVMVEGPAGILAVSPPWFRPNYEPSKRKLTWPNGAIARLYSADEPDRLRGPQCDKLWSDELCAWRYQQEAWDMAMFGLRLGYNPQTVLTSTPRPQKLLKEILSDPQTISTHATTYDNVANLPQAFLNQILRKYKGTRLGRQEIGAEILDDNPNALFMREWIERSRLTRKLPDLVRVVVAVDPPASSDEDSAECGITVSGMDSKDVPHYYVLEDGSIGKCKPNEWAKAAVSLYHKYKADVIVGEANNGGDMVVSTIHSVDPKVNVEKVWASRGKVIRAEPISALCEQGRIHHVGTFPVLEDQMCEWEPGMKSPDRLDSYVWGLTELDGVEEVAPFRFK